MKSVADDVKDILVAAGLGLTFGQNLFIAMEPADKKNCVTIFDLPGRGLENTLNPNVYRYDAIQIRVKGFGYPSQWQLANNITKLLHKKVNFVINQSYYISINAVGSPALLDWTEGGQVRLIINFSIQRKENV